MEYHEVDPNIKYLYHTTTSHRVKSILENGLKTDDLGLIYLSEKPLEGYDSVFKVDIPDINQLIDWREVWHDDNDEPTDMDHDYDPDNPYYIYLSPIAPEYLELLKQ